MIGNLKAGADSASSDIGQVIYRMKMLGFNAIRLPFSFAALAQVTPRTWPTLKPLLCSCLWSHKWLWHHLSHIKSKQSVAYILQTSQCFHAPCALLRAGQQHCGCPCLACRILHASRRLKVSL